MSGGLLVLDTGIVVGLARRSPLGESVRARHLASASAERPLISVVTVAECRAIARHNAWSSAKCEQLDDLFAAFTVVDIQPGGAVVAKYAELYAYLRQRGRNFEKNQNDLWIASLAVAANALLLTTDFDLQPLAPEVLELESFHPKTGELVQPAGPGPV
jgi:predicted nucleic acid-binding protein